MSRRRISRLRKISLNDSHVLGSAEEVQEGAVKFFQDMLSTSPIEWDDDALNLIIPDISDYENELLCGEQNLEEVKVALWSIHRIAARVQMVF